MSKNAHISEILDKFSVFELEIDIKIYTLYGKSSVQSPSRVEITKISYLSRNIVFYSLRCKLKKVKIPIKNGTRILEGAMCTEDFPAECKNENAVCSAG